METLFTYGELTTDCYKFISNFDIYILFNYIFHLKGTETHKPAFSFKNWYLGNATSLYRLTSRAHQCPCVSTKTAPSPTSDDGVPESSDHLIQAKLLDSCSLSNKHLLSISRFQVVLEFTILMTNREMKRVCHFRQVKSESWIIGRMVIVLCFRSGAWWDIRADVNHHSPPVSRNRFKYIIPS